MSIPEASSTDGLLSDKKLSGADPVMPIAIVGLGGRYPGDASNPEKLWDLISNGRSALTEVPKDRFNIDAFYHPHHERQGTINIRGAHFMESDISAFDAPFFSLTPNEAKAMDPQQRMALECTYEALENAGIRMEDVVGSNTSCYVGSFTKDYSEMLAAGQAEEIPLYYGIGTGTAILSNRISWFFDLRGPSISIDTACSSSLVALHLGCQSLRTGESTMSIVGGVNIILVPGVMSAMSSLHFLSPDSKCHSFDESANGYSRGEGASVVVLKPLDLALRDHDVIRGVIRNTAVNQDGNTPGITVPSADAQETLVRSCYESAGLNLTDTQYVEAHGTGTPAGDPIEAAALSKTLAMSRPQGDRLFIGSIKSNIGHLEGASGLAQITKAVFALEKGEIPPNLWYNKPNPRIPMDKWNLQVPVKLTPWPTNGLRRISINSFGYGGTNAHCILDDAYHYLKARGLEGNHNTAVNLGGDSPASSADSGIGMMSGEDLMLIKRKLLDTNADRPTSFGYSDYISSIDTSTSHKLFVWTSNEKSGIDRTAAHYSEYLANKLQSFEEQEDEALFSQFSRTLALRRSILPWKSFAVASSIKELCEAMKRPLESPKRTSKLPKVAFIFTGQGAQWFAMGRELCSHQVFRQSLEAASTYLVTIGATWSLIGELWLDEKASNIHMAAFSQPMCTALQVALVDLLRSWGIKPSAVAGHSSGEIAAAYAKGSISREAAWSISYHRGRLSGNIRGMAPNMKGAMLATNLGAEAVQEYLNQVTEGKATVACINSPSSVTLSGDAAAISQLEVMLKNSGHFARRLKVDTAYHSPQMYLIADLYLNAIGDIRTLSSNDQKIKMFSSVTGRLIEDSDLGPSYWISNMVNQVDFLGAVRSLCQHSDSVNARRAKYPYVDILLEIGPHAALAGPIKQILKTEDSKIAEVSYLSILERGIDANLTALKTVGRLFQYGYPVDIAKANNEQTTPRNDGFLVDIPPFPWNRNNKYWGEPQISKNHRFRKHPRKDLFGAQTIEGLPHEPRWRNMIRLAEIPWVENHKVQGTILYPAAGMMIMAIEAACERADTSREIEGYELRDVLIGKAIVIPQDDSGTETLLCFKPWRLGTQALTSAWQEFTLFSRQGEIWELNCSGLIVVKYKSESNGLFANEDEANDIGYRQKYVAIENECTKVVKSRQFYEHLASIGLQYSGPFQSIAEVKEGPYKSKCALQILDTKSLMPAQYEFSHVIHPTTLDGIIQMGLPAATDIDGDLTIAQVPTMIGRLYVSADVPSQPGSMLYGCAAAENIGFDDAQASVIVSNAAWKKPLVIFERMKSTTLRAAELGFAQAANVRKLVTKFHFQDDVEKIDPQGIVDLCIKPIDTFDKTDSSLVGELELAAFIYMKRLLKSCEPAESRTFAPHLQKFYAFMQRTYCQVVEGTIEHQHQGINWLDTTVEFETELLDRVAKGSTDGAAMCKHGENLVQIMNGTTLPIEILMEDGLLHNFYQSGIGCAEIYAQLAQYMDLLGHKSPDMKVLEIGAGTGGATLPILNALSGQNGSHSRLSNYTFTDISTGFFEKAHEKFKTWLPLMKFAKLNIEEDPLQQGFKTGEFDVIIAANVLHATPSMDQTLANVRKLLKPDGKLILNEITNPLLRVHMIVGSFDGWWIGEKDGREWGPTMTESRWNEVLIKQGYSGVDFALRDFQNPTDHLYSVMVSTASPAQAFRTPEDIVIIEPQAPGEELRRLTTKLVESLRHSGAKIAVKKLQEVAAEDVANKSCIFTLDCENEAPLLPDINSEDWDTLKKAILTVSDSMWVSRGATVNSEVPSANLMTGLSRAMRAENPSLAFTMLDLDSNTRIDTDKSVDAILKIYSSSVNAIKNSRPEWEYAIRDDRILIQRILLESGMNDLMSTFVATPKPEPGLFQQQGRALKLQVGTPGRLDTLRFVEDESYGDVLGEDEVEIQVKGVGLNFKDVMIAMGQLQELALGVDCSGLVSRVGSQVTKFQPGDRVMTWRLGTFRNFARTPESMCVSLPEDMDFSTAASLPVIYSTSYYAIFDVARLQRGESILIHGAAGGVGQTAIILAQHIGAEIFATVSSEAKKNLLMEIYGIAEDHIFNSRDDSFVNGVMRMTKERGVNVVLNSLAGEFLRKSWHCLAWFGRFIEMGQKDIAGNTGLDMAPFIRNISFHSINLLGLLEHDLPKASAVFQNAMDLFHKKIAKPVHPTISMPFSQIEDAFRLMQTGKHLGKIVLEPKEDDIVPVIPPGVPPYRFDSNSTYVLSGGSGGLGRSLALWMVRQGARNIIFLSRSGDKKPEARKTIEELVQKGVKVTAYSCDVGNAEQVEEVLRKSAEEYPPIRGVIQGAMVLKDAIYQNMTHEQFQGVIGPKVQGSWNLHNLLPKDMDFFILLSSSAGIAGSRGQGNYAAGNSYQDALAHYRRGKNLPAAVIDLGVVLEVGFLADNTEDRIHDNTKNWNFIGIREKELHAMVQAAITGTSINNQTVPTQMITGLGTGGMAHHAGIQIPWWFSDAKFTHIKQVDIHTTSSSSVSDADGNSMPLSALLSQASSVDAAADIISVALVQKLARSLMVSVDDIEVSRPISRYGVDSLLAVEIRSWLFTEVQADISVFDLLSNVPISELVRRILGKSKCVDVGCRGGEGEKEGGK